MTKIESFKFLLGNEKVNMVLTDPPYDLAVKNIVGNGNKGTRVNNKLNERERKRARF